MLMNSGESKTARDMLNGVVFEEPGEGLVVAHDLDFYSLCEHHLIPFFGRAHVAYLPAGRVIARSALPRLLDVFARRLQVQERLTDQVARAIQAAIEPRGVAVQLEAAHFCRMMRGIERRESLTLTSTFLGEFERDRALRHEIYEALGAREESRQPRQRRPEIARAEGSAAVGAPRVGALRGSPQPQRADR
jgi:GTP cyclohydrolase I